ncbi:hypothetical protein L665_04559 [Ralstonia solanacearum SD54]|nr:hypothetical protein F504_3318 [Ralstonia pseudosolanacearum FQY_4]ANH31374.1 hypothetical protein A3768_0182 [Ralstonia solanacearum]ESS47839.1 hypothetical protein L665_04559 [Ralstonia solanacearum SD54]
MHGESSFGFARCPSPGRPSVAIGPKALSRSMRRSRLSARIVER